MNATNRERQQHRHRRGHPTVERQRRLAPRNHPRLLCAGPALPQSEFAKTSPFVVGKCDTAL